MSKQPSVATEPTNNIKEEGDEERSDEKNERDNGDEKPPPPGHARRVLSWTTTNDIEAALKESAIQTVTSWYGSPYRIESFAQHMQGDDDDERSHYATVIEALQKLGIQVYLIDASRVDSQDKLTKPILEAMDFASQENYVPTNAAEPIIGWQRCLLYKDEQNRLFNLVLPQALTSMERTWREQFECFSVVRALVALTILLRQIPCAANKANMVQSLKPFFLCLLLAFVFNTEIKSSVLNSSMMVRGTPSISAHTVKYTALSASTTFLGTSSTDDGLRKVVLFCLALASPATGWFQRFLTILGIALACIVLLANLGARSWQFLGIEPIQYRGRGSFVYAYFWAVLAGIAMPFMGHRFVTTGGKTAMEHVLMASLIVGVFIVITAQEAFQTLMVVGSSQCNQKVLHLNLGFWWMFTVIFSLMKVKSIQCRYQQLPNGEKLLVEDHASPVGRRLPLLPDYIFDITSASGPPYYKYLGVAIEFGLYILAALALGYFYSRIAAR